MLKVGLLGAGMMGGVHAEMWAKIPDAAVVAIHNIQDDELEKIQKHLPEIKHYKNEAEFFKSGIEAIDIALPTFLHKKYIEKGLQHGLDVITEKPLCRTIEEANEILELSQKVDRHIYVAHVIRFWPEYIYLKNTIQSGRLGKLRNLYMGRYTSLPRWSINDWLLKRELSGATPLDLQVHDIDFILSVIGEPEEVQCKILEHDGLHVWTQYSYARDSVVVLEAGNDLPEAFGFEMTYRALFKEGMLIFSSVGDHGLVEYTDKARKINLSEQPEASLDAHLPTGNSYHTELAHFVDCIRKNIPSEIVSVESAAQTVKMILGNL